MVWPCRCRTSYDGDLISRRHVLKLGSPSSRNPHMEDYQYYSCRQDSKHCLSSDRSMHRSQCLLKCLCSTQWTPTESLARQINNHGECYDACQRSRGILSILHLHSSFHSSHQDASLGRICFWCLQPPRFHFHWSLSLRRPSRLAMFCIDSLGQLLFSRIRWN